MTLFPEPPPATLAGPTPRVQHIPADHPYVRQLAAVPGEPAGFEPRPDPTGPVEKGSWRPSPALDGAWIDAHADEWDIVHLHFGYEHLAPAEVAAWTDAVHRAGRRLVVTVHDLDNPHLLDQRRHHATVAAALAGADQVVTLTAGAAAEVLRRWGRRAVVIDHPHVLPLEVVGTRMLPRTTTGPLQLGVPFGSLRANVAAAPVLRLLSAGAGAEVRIRVSRQVFDDGAARGEAIRTELTVGADRGHWELDVVEPGEPEVRVWEWVSSLDALILPYAWGTHSAWVETCADVGTAVIAPTTGFWHQQHDLVPVPAWGTATPADLAAAVGRLRDPGDPAGGGRQPLTADARRAQRAAVHAAHAALYRQRSVR